MAACMMLSGACLLIWTYTFLENSLYLSRSPEGDLNVLVRQRGQYWALLVIIGHYLSILGVTCQYWALLVKIGRYLSILGDTCQYWALLVNIGRYLLLLGVTCHFLLAMMRHAMPTFYKHSPLPLPPLMCASASVQCILTEPQYLMNRSRVKQAASCACAVGGLLSYASKGSILVLGLRRGRGSLCTMCGSLRNAFCQPLLSTLPPLVHVQWGGCCRTRPRAASSLCSGAGAQARGSLCAALP